VVAQKKKTTLGTSRSSITSSSPSIKPLESSPAVGGVQATLSAKDELLSVLKHDPKSQEVSFLITSKEWAKALDGLEATVSTALPWVKMIVDDVLTPLGDAQAFAAAIIGVVAAITDTIMTVRANNAKCTLLARRIEDLKPSMGYLLTNLNEKVTTIMSKPVSYLQGEGQRFKRDAESLFPPLRSMQKACEECAAIVTEWTAKGKRLFGAMRKFFTAKNFAGQFQDCSQLVIYFSLIENLCFFIYLFVVVGRVEPSIAISAASSYLHEYRCRSSSASTSRHGQLEPADGRGE
jgi:hypothetical protein